MAKFPEPPGVEALRAIPPGSLELVPDFDVPSLQAAGD